MDHYFKDWSVPDWLKLAANALAGAAAGYAQGGWVGAVVTGVATVLAFLQRVPGAGAK